MEFLPARHALVVRHRLCLAQSRQACIALKVRRLNQIPWTCCCCRWQCWCQSAVRQNQEGGLQSCHCWWRHLSALQALYQAWCTVGWPLRWHQQNVKGCLKVTFSRGLNDRNWNCPCCKSISAWVQSSKQGISMVAGRRSRGVASHAVLTNAQSLQSGIPELLQWQSYQRDWALLGSDRWLRQLWRFWRSHTGCQWRRQTGQPWGPKIFLPAAASAQHASQAL